MKLLIKETAFLPAAKVLELWELFLLLWGGTSFMSSWSYPYYYLISHPKFSPGWDPCLPDQISLRGGIQGS